MVAFRYVRQYFTRILVYDGKCQMPEEDVLPTAEPDVIYIWKGSFNLTSKHANE